jgi:hypothetical protein
MGRNNKCLKRIVLFHENKCPFTFLYTVYNFRMMVTSKVETWRFVKVVTVFNNRTIFLCRSNYSLTH